MKYNLKWKKKERCTLVNALPGLYLQWSGCCFWFSKGRELINGRPRYPTISQDPDDLWCDFSFEGFSGIFNVTHYYGNENLKLEEVELGEYVHNKSGHKIILEEVIKPKYLLQRFNAEFCLKVKSFLADEYLDAPSATKTKTLKIPNTCAKGLFKYYKKV